MSILQVYTLYMPLKVEFGDDKCKIDKCKVCQGKGQRQSHYESSQSRIPYPRPILCTGCRRLYKPNNKVPINYDRLPCNHEDYTIVTKPNNIIYYECDKCDYSIIAPILKD